jgi:hypothetical protein
MGRTGVAWLRIGSSRAGFCEHGNETSVSIKKLGCFYKLSDYQLLKQYPAQWSE